MASACNKAMSMRSRSLKLAGIRNTLSIRWAVLSGRVSANSSARFTIRRALCVVESQAAKANKTNMPIQPKRFMRAKIRNIPLSRGDKGTKKEDFSALFFVGF